MKTSIQVLFLDFDGVLHPEVCNESMYFVHKAEFEALVRAFPEIDLVISSTWRLKRELSALQSLFSPDVAARIIGVTPLYADLKSVPETLVGYEREAECRAWLWERGRACDVWLALDDRSWNFRPFNSNVFLVDGEVGLNSLAAGELCHRIATGRCN